MVKITQNTLTYPSLLWYQSHAIEISILLQPQPYRTTKCCSWLHCSNVFWISHNSALLWTSTNYGLLLWLTSQLNRNNIKDFEDFSKKYCAHVICKVCSRSLIQLYTGRQWLQTYGLLFMKIILITFFRKALNYQLDWKSQVKHLYCNAQSVILIPVNLIYTSHNVVFYGFRCLVGHHFWLSL